MPIWRYKLNSPFTLDHGVLSGITFESDWVHISNGRIRIETGYAWDGCTPAYPILKGRFFPTGLWVGIWDGPLGIDCRPAAWIAALVHDVLCQYREQLHGVTKAHSVAIFRELLKMNNAPGWMTVLYPYAVEKLGPQRWLGDDLFVLADIDV